MKAPLIEQTAVPDTFCLFYVNNFLRAAKSFARHRPMTFNLEAT